MSYLANGFRTAALAAAVGAFAMLAGPANAAPLGSATSAISQSDDGALTFVADGCGRGWRWSNSRGRCVPMGGGGPGYGPGYVDPGAAIVGGIVGGIVQGVTRPAGCPPGTRWSNRRGGCVYY